MCCINSCAHLDSPLSYEWHVKRKRPQLLTRDRQGKWGDHDLAQRLCQQHGSPIHLRFANFQIRLRRFQLQHLNLLFCVIPWSFRRGSIYVDMETQKTSPRPWQHQSTGTRTHQHHRPEQPREAPRRYRRLDEMQTKRHSTNLAWVESESIPEFWKNRISSNQMTLRTSEKDEVSILPSCESCPSVMALFI